MISNRRHVDVDCISISPERGQLAASSIIGIDVDKEAHDASGSVSIRFQIECMPRQILEIEDLNLLSPFPQRSSQLAD